MKAGMPRPWPRPRAEQPATSDALDTLRRYPRTRCEAFREWPENAIGIEAPPVAPPQPPLWARAVARVLELVARR